MSEKPSGSLVAASSSQAILSAADIKAQVKRVQEVMRAVMEEGTHYGTVTRGGKPSLWKAGSEVLLSTFRIAVDPEVEELSTPDEIRYRITCRGRHIPTGLMVGGGVGEASTSEEKYKWRAAVCDEEFDETEETHRRIKYGWEWGERRGEKVTTRVQQVRTQPADLANTVLKMAKKRAQIDLTLTALAASDIFVQDYEDEDGTLHPSAVEDTRNIKPRTAPPKAAAPAATAGDEHDEFRRQLDGNGNGNGQASAPDGGPAATKKQVGLILHRLEDKEIPASEFLAHFEIGRVDELPRDQVDPALAWIRDRAR